MSTTDLVAAIDAPKLAPEKVGEATTRGILAGDEEVLVDDFSRTVNSSLSDDLRLLYAAD